VIRFCVLAFAAVAGLGLAGIGGTLGSPVVRANEATTDEVLLMGTWEVTRFTLNGQMVPMDGCLHDIVTLYHQYRFDEKSLTKIPMVPSDRNKQGLCSYRLDSSKNPKQIEIQPLEDSDQGKRPSTVHLYKVDKDSLVLCWSMKDGGPSPERFESKPGEGQALLEFRRVREE
jgi:uncharacterized protein (TIGR03067 family)